jgi:DNA polymerase III sliding clamp (beta) subunit (PCNA family)
LQDSPAGTATFYFEANALIIETPNLRLSFVLIGDAYPDVLPFADSPWDTQVTVDAQALKEALAVMKLFTDSDHQKARFHFRPGPHACLALQSIDPRAGETEEELDVDMTGVEQALYFNVDYVISAVDETRTPTVRLRYDSQQPYPSLLVQPDASDPDFAIDVIAPLGVDKPAPPVKHTMPAPVGQAAGRGDHEDPG